MIPVPIMLIIIVMMGTLIIGLLKPPLNVVAPLLGIYVILMLIPYIIPNLAINQYLTIRNMSLPLVGLALGYGVAVVAERFMNVDIASLLGLRHGKTSTTSSKERKVRAVHKVEKKLEIRPEDIDKIITESINTLRLGVVTNEALGTSLEYYENWADAIMGISKNYLVIKECTEALDRDATAILRFKDYETKALELGFSLHEESSFKSSRKPREGRLVVYVRLEDIATEIINSAQLLDSHLKKLDNLIEKVMHNEEFSQYMLGSHVFVLYVDGLPRHIILLH
ncbi:MAG: hypothetical protein TU36_003935 [Vulcanisaeta sp. AZ3]